MGKTTPQKLVAAWTDRSKRITLLFMGTMGCGVVFLISLLYGASTGGHPPNIGMIISGSMAVALGLGMLVSIVIDVIDCD